MNPEITPHLVAIAVVMNMTRINDEFYYGENKTLFKATNFGFRLATIKDLANKVHPFHLNAKLMQA